MISLLFFKLNSTSSFSLPLNSRCSNTCKLMWTHFTKATNLLYCRTQISKQQPDMVSQVLRVSVTTLQPSGDTFPNSSQDVFCLFLTHCSWPVGSVRFPCCFLPVCFPSYYPPACSGAWSSCSKDLFFTFMNFMRFLSTDLSRLSMSVWLGAHPSGTRNILPCFISSVNSLNALCTRIQVMNEDFELLNPGVYHL